MSRRNTRRRWQSHVCGGRQPGHGAAYGVERREPPEGTVGQRQDLQLHVQRSGRAHREGAQLT